MVYITPARTSEYRGGRVSWCDGLLWNSSAPACVVPEAGARTTCGWDDVDVDPWCGWSQRSASGRGVMPLNMTIISIPAVMMTISTGPSRTSPPPPSTPGPAQPGPAPRKVPC